MLATLLPIALTSADEGLAYLKRETGDDVPKALGALNQAAGRLELLTGRKLAFRTYRDQVAVDGCSCTLNTATIVTDSGVIKEGDAAYSLGGADILRPGSQVISVGAIAVVLNVPVLQTVDPFTLTVGSAPELQDVGARDAWSGDRTGADWPIYTQETPIGEVFAVKVVAADGTKTALDLAGMRIEHQTGAIYLPNAAADPGALTLEIHYSAGFRFPSGATEGHPAEALTAQNATHWLAQIIFQDQMSGRGRASDKSLGGKSSSGALALPDELKGMVQLLRRD